MSQLDCSVLDALPLSLRNQILRTYEKSVKSEDIQLSKLLEREREEALSLLTSTSDGKVQEQDAVLSLDRKPDDIAQCNVHVTEATTTESEADSPQVCTQRDSVVEGEIIIDDEAEFLKEFRKYIKDWVANSREGPKESDAVKFTDFFTSFAQSNLEIAQVTLKFFRRLVQGLEESGGWSLYFNTLLGKVQDVTKQCFGGTLKIAELDI